MADEYVLVTGAAGFLGTAVSAHLAAIGYRVIGVDLAADCAQPASLHRFIGQADLTEAASVTKLAAQIDHPLHGLVNVAGGFAWETVSDGSIDTWDRLYRMNVKTAVLTSRALLPLLKVAHGAIVNVSANGSVKADAGMGAYAASKSGVSRFTEALAAELKDDLVRVNAVLPSIIDTPVNRADMPDADFSRWVSPDALADVIAFLLSDAARAVTGALLPVTGRV
jgi:NAD(P)-dependent dehydrogenase (short-subunit alcohol dehydrogenase family)